MMEDSRQVAKRYQTLRSTAAMLRKLAWSDLIGSVVAGIILGVLVAQALPPMLNLAGNTSLVVAILAFLVTLVAVVYAGIWWFLVLRTWAEGIMAFIDIEENTRVLRDRMDSAPQSGAVSSRAATT